MATGAERVYFDRFDTFGALLRYLRRRRRLTQRALALAVGYSEAQICRLERNRRRPELSALVAQFVPALGLQGEPELTRCLLGLATAARPERPPNSDYTDGWGQGHDTAAPVATGHERATSQHPDHATGRGAGLPSFLTSFVGRRRELEELCHLLSEEQGARLLVLTGPPGTGKTRLAVHVAVQLAGQFAGGATFVSLAAVRDPDLVAPTIKATLHRPESSRRSTVEELIGVLSNREALLVLDNFEQLAAAAPLLATLLTTCPRLRVLVTSRTVLHLHGAQHYLVLPLAVPDLARLPPAEQLLEYDAVRLFVERATAALPTFSLTDQNARMVAALCRGLDGLPLAIELAAARVNALSVEQLASYLDRALPVLTAGSADTDPRQRTLKAALAWSYDLLEEGERKLFDRLSVFANGWTLEAAEAICSMAPLTRGDILPLLVQLVDHSVVLIERHGGGVRYRLLEVLRQYGAEHTVRAGEAEELRKRHALWFRKLAEEARTATPRLQRTVWSARLELEYDNLWAALHCLEATGAFEQGLDLASDLHWFWELRGRVREARTYLARLLAVSQGTSRELRARVLHAAASLARYAGDLATAATYADEAILLWRALGDVRGLAIALYTSGHIAHQRSDFSSATVRYEESLTCWRNVGDHAGTARVLQRLGVLAQEQGNREEARQWYEQALALWQELADPLAIATCYNSLGGIAQEQQQYERAVFLYGEDLRLRRELGDRLGMACALDGLGVLAREQGDYGRAIAMGDEAVRIKRELDEREQLAYSLYTLCLAVCLRGDYERAASLAREMINIDRELGSTVDMARRLEGLAAVMASSAPAPAAQLLGTATALRRVAGTPPRNPRHHEELTTSIRSRLCPAAFAIARSAGQMMTPEEAVAVTLAAPARAMLLRS